MGKTRFRQIYDALPEKATTAPKTEWVNRMAKICMVHPTTVRCWLAGTQHPDAIKTSILSKELGVPTHELFRNR